MAHGYGCGRINFDNQVGNRELPRYLYLSSHTDRKGLCEYMTTHWELSPPKLIVSLIESGEKFVNFKTKKLEEAFTTGLIDLASTTGAWIISPGYHEGLYRLVGKACRRYNETSDDTSAQNSVRLVGVMPWVSVAGGEHLIQRGHGMAKAVYPLSDIEVSEGQHRLDPNHSHFIFVDEDEIPHTTASEVSADCSGWRYEYEKYLCTCANTAIVRLLANGNSQSLSVCAKSLSSDVPLVVVSETGGAASLITALVGIKTSPTDLQLDDSIITHLYKHYMGISEPSKADLQNITTILTKIHMVVLHSDDNDEGIGLDMTILSTLYKHEGVNIEQRKCQLRMALALNRADYARDFVLDIKNVDYKELMREHDFMHEILTDALVEDKPELVQVLIDNGVQLGTFTQHDSLARLYGAVLSRDEPFPRFFMTFRQKIVSDQTTCCSNGCRHEDFDCGDSATSQLWLIGKTIEILLQYIMPNLYPRSVQDSRSDGEMNNMRETNEARSNPAQHLYLWALLFNRIHMSQVFWKYIPDNLAGVIVGGALLRGLSKFREHQEDVEVTDSYKRSSVLVEKKAIDLLKICWEKNRSYTADMLTRKTSHWGNITVLSLAYHSHMENFMAQRACYVVLAQIWRGEISPTIHFMKIIGAALFPPLLMTLKFTPSESKISKTTTGDMNEHKGQGNNIAQLINVSLLPRNKNEISIITAFFKLLNTAFAKAQYHMIGCMIYLSIFSLFLMTELRNTHLITVDNTTQPYNATHNLPGYCISYICCDLLHTTGIGCLEIITYIMTFNFFVDDIRQIAYMESTSMKYNLKYWWSSFWNCLDAMSYTFFILATISRFFETDINTAPDSWFAGNAVWLWGFSIASRYGRFTHNFYVFESLGPKIIMVFHMFKDLLLFMVILILCILACGTIQVSINYPRSNLDRGLARDVFFKPFFMIYGELFIDDLQTETKSRSDSWVVLAIYLLFTNILLINLLIAMFSNTFQQIQARSVILWRYNLYSIVYHHTHSTYLPLVGQIYQLFRRCCRSYADDVTLFRRKLTNDRNECIDKFLHQCTEKYLSYEAKTGGSRQGGQILDTISSVDRSTPRTSHQQDMENMGQRIEYLLRQMKEEMQKDVEKQMNDITREIKTFLPTEQQTHASKFKNCVMKALENHKQGS